MEDFFFPISSKDQRSDADQSQIIGVDADADHTQFIRGIQSNYWGGISLHLPLDFGTPAYSTIFNFKCAIYAFKIVMKFWS